MPLSPNEEKYLFFGFTLSEGNAPFLNFFKFMGYIKYWWDIINLNLNQIN